MPHSSDDPSSDRIDAETPSAPSAEGVASESASPSEVNPAAGSGEPPRPFRRRRRRRRPPRPADPAEAVALSPSQTERPATPEDTAESGDLAATPPPEDAAESGDLTATPPPEVGPRRRRRRRRRPPRPAEASAAEADKTVTPSAAEGTPAGAPRNRSAPYRSSRSRGAGNRSSDEQPSERRPPGDSRRAPDRRGRGKGPPSRNDRRQGRDRAPPRKKPEPRLYALEAIVDRGFEDLVDAAEDNLTRRVHWTIIKRTVADQESGKPISATYVLKRDGVDTEFPGLGAARAAANKTIVHPEKLTLSKAEHAAAKK
jgi:hypothetical protein